jgi:hypothetical protein
VRLALFQAVASPETPHWKLIYVGVHLAAAILAFLLLLRNATSSGTAANGPERTALSIWLGLQLALALVLRGAQGFDDLPRYVSLATPAIVIAFAPWVVKSRWLVPVLCIASTGLATIPARRNAAPVCADLAMVAEMEDASAIATRRRLRP